MTATNHLNLAADGWLGGTAERTGIMDTKHTPGPLEAHLHTDGYGFALYNQRATEIAAHTNVVVPLLNEREREYHKDEIAANAHRLVACWNACEGLNPEAVPGLLAACKGLLAHVQLAGAVRAVGRGVGTNTTEGKKILFAQATVAKAKP